MLSALLVLLFGGVVLAAIVRANRRLDGELAASGKCLSCLGLGSAWVNMNGLEGCGDCCNRGTLAAYNERRRQLRWRPLTVESAG